MEIDGWKIWKRIWEKSMKMSVSYHNWKDPREKGSVNSFSKRKDELHNEVMKILNEIAEKVEGTSLTSNLKVVNKEK